MSTAALPRHIAIIMDGNGRWAKQRHLPRFMGHKAGVESVRRIVTCCAEKKIEVLTIFAFSNENWRRPEQEVSFLMDLFISGLKRETTKLHEQNIQVRVIGNRSQFNEKLQAQIAATEALTAQNTGLKFVIAANYGGQWDINEAVRSIANEVAAGRLNSADITPELIQKKLSLADLPDPDLLIRTSGEQRISNFMLWQIAYTELYFTDVLWPDFDTEKLEQALTFFSNRERRFGCTSEQLRINENA
jgi:undecaprenyl diphosphate synthase